MASILVCAYDGGVTVTLDKWDWTALTIDGYTKDLTNGTYKSGFHAGGTAFHATAKPHTVGNTNVWAPAVLKADNYVYIFSQYCVLNSDTEILDLYGSINVVPLASYNPNAKFDSSPFAFSQIHMTGIFQLGKG